jgi:superoxide dismutase, Cu-Zn family
VNKRPLAVPAALAGGLALSLIALSPAGGHGGSASAKLRGPDGTVAGTVTFRVEHDHTNVRLRLKRTPTVDTARDAFHGFHIHANDDPGNGDGCIAGSPAGDFVAVDGHWKKDGQLHGLHTGDLPSVLIHADGTAELRFTTDRLDLNELEGRAVILHAGPDNFGNVPVGAAADQYTANSPAAGTATSGTGNAGKRIACGLIER